MAKFRYVLIAALLAPLADRAPAPAQSPEIETFRVEECFGVNHPTQIIDFDLDQKTDASRVHMVDEGGQPVAFQILEDGKKVAMQTDLLAGQSRQWKLLAGPAPKTVPTKLEVTEYTAPGRSGYQITNGITGIRVSKPVMPQSLNLHPLVDLFNYGPNVPRVILAAPLQGVLFPDGTWGGTGPNAVTFFATSLASTDIRFIERGPLKVVVEVSYILDHPAYSYGSILLAPAGRGHYRSTITVEAGQPSILFEEDTDLEMTWSINLYEAVQPTAARYRGHHASQKECGYEPDGQTYRPVHARPPMDAQVDLNYDTVKSFSYTGGPANWRGMAAWDPWAVDTGWYWQMYNAKAGENGRLLGIFAGRASRALDPGFSGVSLLTMPSPMKGAPPMAGLTVASYRRGPNNQVYPRSRFEWGLFVGAKKDLRDPKEIQPINLQMNLHAGFNLNKLHRYTIDFPDPPGGYGGLYMDRKAVEALKAKLREDKKGPHGGGFHQYLYNAEPTARPLIDMWADAKPDKLRLAIAEIRKTASDMLRTFVEGDGVYSFQWHYWMGGVVLMRHAIWIDQILADSRTTEAERRQVKAAAVLFANVLWDNDFVPLDNFRGINLGTANMPVQQASYRDFYALLLARHPTMAARAALVEANCRKRLRNLINEYGAEIGCPHYIAASVGPVLNTLLQLKQLGKEDPFKAEPRLAKFAEFYLNLQTPPEPFVGRKRALIALGDSSTEPSELYGVLATGFRDADPKLSARLMGAWHANGKPHSGFFGTTLLMIDEGLPAADPRLSDASFPGYYSVLRHGWGTPNETAIWLVNGDHYSDHRHHDACSLVIYALGQPLSLNWGGLYTPQTSGAYTKSGVVLESSLREGDRPFAWDGDAPPLGLGTTAGKTTLLGFKSFPEGAYMKAQFTSEGWSWKRAVTVIKADESHPILIVRDSFGGAQAGAPKVMTLNLVAEGMIECPLGRMKPPLRTHPVKGNGGETTAELPSALPPIPLNSGVSRFGFRGKYDVDWDVYSISDEDQQTLVGSWAVTPWGWAITDKTERQHILRIRGAGAFTTVILPWRRGAKPGELTVTREGDAVVIKSSNSTARIDPDGFEWTGTQGSVKRDFTAR